MPLKSHSFVELFTQEVKAGVIEAADERNDSLKMNLKRVMFSRLVGMYSADMSLLLLDQKCFYYSDFGSEVVPVGVPQPVVEVVRELDVTNAVMKLPEVAQAWHTMCRVTVDSPVQVVDQSTGEIITTVTVTGRGSPVEMTDEQMERIARMTNAEYDALRKRHLREDGKE